MSGTTAVGSKPHALYRFFNTDGHLLYAGITAAPGTRFGQHKSAAQWWNEAATAELTWYPDRARAEAAEKAAIETEDPIYNQVHTNLHVAAGSLRTVERRALAEASRRQGT